MEIGREISSTALCLSGSGITLMTVRPIPIRRTDMWPTVSDPAVPARYSPTRGDMVRILPAPSPWQYWMERRILPECQIRLQSMPCVDGVMQNVCTDKASVPLDNNGNACIFSLTVTDAVLDWVSLYPGRPVRPCAQEWVLCQRYYQKYTLSLPPIKENIGCGTIRHAADSFSGAYARCADCDLYSSGWQQRYFLLQYA